MRYVVLLNGKPIEEASEEEMKALEEKTKRVFEKYLGLKYVGGKELMQNAKE